MSLRLILANSSTPSSFNSISASAAKMAGVKRNIQEMYSNANASKNGGGDHHHNGGGGQHQHYHHSQQQRLLIADSVDDEMINNSSGGQISPSLVLTATHGGGDRTVMIGAGGNMHFIFRINQHF